MSGEQRIVRREVLPYDEDGAGAVVMLVHVDGSIELRHDDAAPDERGIDLSSNQLGMLMGLAP